MNLRPAIEDVQPLLGGEDGVAVEVCRALLELGEILDGLQGPLRPEEALDVDAPQRGRLDAAAELLRAYVADQVHRARGVAVHVAVEAGDAPHAASGFSVLRSAVALNCCCGNWVTSRRSPSSCFGFSMPLNRS